MDKWEMLDSNTDMLEEDLKQIRKLIRKGAAKNEIRRKKIAKALKPITENAVANAQGLDETVDMI